MLTAKLSEFRLWEQEKRPVLHINQSHTISFSYQILINFIQKTVLSCLVSCLLTLLNFLGFIYTIICLVINLFNKICFQVLYVVTRAFAFANLEGSNFNWGSHNQPSSTH